MVTMSQNPSLMQRPQLVPWALTSNKQGEPYPAKPVLNTRSNVEHGSISVDQRAILRLYVSASFEEVLLERVYVLRRSLLERDPCRTSKRDLQAPELGRIQFLSATEPTAAHAPETDVAFQTAHPDPTHQQ